MSDTPSPAKFWHGKRGEYLVVAQFVIMVGFIALPVWTPAFIAASTAKLALLRWSGLLLCASIALIFGGLGSHHLGNSLTPLPYPVDHGSLVKNGVYAWVRHPLYSSLLFAALGWILFTFSLSHVAFGVFGFAFFNYKAQREERWLTQRYPEYTEYAQRVKKFIPGVY